MTSFSARLPELVFPYAFSNAGGGRAAGKEHADQLGAAASSRDLAVAERDALRAKIVEWETAMKQRDENIASQNDTISGLRKKLDEAIENLKKAGAR